MNTASSSATTITMNAPETVTANFNVTPKYIVTTNLDDPTGTAANCTTPGPNCSLRDALTAANTSGANITFDSTAFAATRAASARTITLGTAGTLIVPSSTTINGLTTGSGATLTNLVTVSGANQATVFTINGGVTNAAITGLNITDGFTAIAGGGILNSGVYRV